MGRPAHLFKLENGVENAFQTPKHATPIITLAPSMSTPTERILGILALARPWESVAAGVGALLVGLLVGTAVLTRRNRRVIRERERERESLSRIALALARIPDAEGVARVLLDEICTYFGVDFAALTFVSEDGAEGTGFLARSGGGDIEWWRDVHLDLRTEPSGIAQAARETEGFAVLDVSDSSLVSPQLAGATGAKSAAFVPLTNVDRVIGVISVATTARQREFSAGDLSMMQALASEAAIALERARSTIALAQALERERLVLTIGRRLRTEPDLAPALRATVEAAGRALGASRCFVRLSGKADVPIAAEWRGEGAASVGLDAERLPVSNLAAGNRRTVAVADIERAPELADPALGGIERLRELGVRGVASTPILAEGETYGVLTAHRDVPRAWTQGDLALLEALAVEVSLAVRLGRLMDENRERLGERSALLRAAEVVSSELESTDVLQRLVDEVAELLQADASDCYLYDRERGTLRCAAVHGLEASLVGFEFSADRGLSGLSIREGRPLVATEYGAVPEEVPHPAYATFTDALVAPMRWADDMRGVLGVGRRGSRAYGKRDMDVLEAFASLASLALRNAETFTQSARQARVQRGFYRIAAILGESLSRPETLDAVAQAAAEALGGAASVALMPTGGRLAVAGSHELPEQLAGLVAEGLDTRDDPIARAAAQGRVIAAPELAGDERVPATWREAAAQVGLRALLCVPVESPRQGPGGLVAVFFSEPHTFSEEDLELVRHLAGAARGALERSELFETERTARALAQQLARTGRLLTTELDPAAVRDEVVQLAPELVHADACAIRVVEDGELVVSAAAGKGAREALDARSSIAAWLSADVVQSRAPVALDDAGSDPRLRGLDPMLAAGNVGYLGVPLAGPEGSLHGVLSVYSAGRRQWREEEIDALLALAASTSGALANAELYQRVALEKERSVAILANIADGIVAVDREGTVVLWNAAAEKITGVPTEDVLGRAPLEVLGRDFDADLVPIMRGREEVWLSVTEAVMRDPAGGVAGRIFAFRDISSDRLVEQMKSDFVSTVSHELRTPLTSIYGFAETLLRQDVDFGETERATFLGYIASESLRLTQIVDALLNVARLDTGDLQVRLTATDVREVVGDAVRTLEQVGSNGHRLVVDLPEEPLAATADPDKLRQVFAILLDNALRYSPGGGIVKVGAERKAETVELIVEDQGVGIPLGDQEQIFRKFYRGIDADSRVGAGGTGLGLFIARGLVSAMGGTISVSSREGEGSTFAIELPLADGRR
jgi:GAF domain-containing protein